MRNVITLILKNNTLLRWALVGLITSAIDYLIFVSLYSVIVSVLISNFFAGVCSVTFNYLAHYSWSFKSNSNHAKSIIKYFFNFLIYWSFGTLIISYCITAGIDSKIAKLFPIVIIAPLSFLSLKMFVFKKKFTMSLLV
jgi:putative flippase GtrA